MLRLGLCGLIKAHQAGCWAAWQATATAVLSAQHQHAQHGTQVLGCTDPWQQQSGGAWLHQQQQYSQQPQSIKPEQQQQQEHQKLLGPGSKSSTVPAKTASTADGNGGASSKSSSAGNGSSSGSSSSGSNGSAGAASPADKAGPGTPGYKRKVVYTGATTAAQANMRTAVDAAALQQLLQQQQEALEQPELPPPHLSQDALEQPEFPPVHLSKQQAPWSQSSKPQKPQHQQQQWRREAPAYQDPASGSSSNKLQQDAEQIKEQHWEMGHKHYTEAQQMQWQVQANYQKQPPQQQQYKVVQYSRGTSLLLALSAQPSGDYSLQKTKGPASAADLAAFGRTKPAKDGAAAAAKAAKELPLLLRPFHPYWLILKKSLQATFLPSGYPTSVGSNYLEYTLWQAVTNFATTANGVLASTFLLYSVGLGAGAIPTAGALNWVLKDGLGQMGTLLFGKAIAHNFDIHSKTWYFMSFLLLSTATGLEIATILVPHAFLVLGSCANMIKGLSWMAGGSTRSVFNLSFVRDNNIADITAKNTSQYIFASLFGTAAGVSCCAYIGQSAPLALLCFSGLAYTSMYSAYRTVKSIPLPTLNSSRLQLLAARYLKCVRTTASDGFPGVLSYERQQGFLSYQQEYEVPEDEDDTCELNLPSPLDMAEMDNPLPWVSGDPRLMNPGIHVGSQLDRLVEGQPAMLVVVLNTFRYSRYLLVPERNAIHLVLHAEAAPRDMVQAYLQACILRKVLKTGHSISPDNLPELRIILHDTLLAAENLTPPFMRALARQGWQTEKIVVEAHRRRARW